MYEKKIGARYIGSGSLVPGEEVLVYRRDAARFGLEVPDMVRLRERVTARTLECLANPLPNDLLGHIVSFI